MGDRRTIVSKYLALHLRHKPERIGLRLDESGWANVAEFLALASADGFPIDLDELVDVVATNDKARYEFNPPGDRIRARQGHSIAVDLGLEPVAPPTTLYHGTVERSVPSILREGLRPMSRQYVHLSADVATAVIVGSRRQGQVTVLAIDAGKAYDEGLEFWIAGNGVWLAREVPPSYVTVTDHTDR